MAENNKRDDGLAVPFRRLSRVARFGGMAANVAGGMFFDGVQKLASGKRPRVSDLLLTPANAMKVKRQLSNMRGAAMKIGQMLSMDSGDFLPRELADILADLRDSAQHMPRRQLDKVLQAEWGDDWEERFAEFDCRPIAAASIGEVHKAITHDGMELAIKVQYPGVKESIDSDIGNVATLLRMTGLVPAKLDIKPILEEARQQLHQEADYVREGKYLSRYAKALASDTDFVVPKIYPEFSTRKILAMSYIESDPIEAMITAPQDKRDRIGRLLIDLLLRELFELGLMQTDPNFANYRYNRTTDQLVLLDFGATRDVSNTMAASYRKLMRAIISSNDIASFKAAMDMALIAPDLPEKYHEAVFDLLNMAMEPLQTDGLFDFGNNQIARRMRDKGIELAKEQELWHLPPPETLFIQRKFSGIYMLVSRLKARVNVRSLMLEYIGSKHAGPNILEPNDLGETK